MSQLVDRLERCDEDERVAVIVLTGSERAFAAGADILEMREETFSTAFKRELLTFWTKVSDIKKPLIAAVDGFALGGGCELALMCDIVIASDRAKFGQPEVTIGTIPGGGGTQRLARIVGKSKAMEMCLTGDMIDAEEALRCHMVSKVVPSAQLLAEANKMASRIASHSTPIVCLAKEAINAAYESPLSLGVALERRLFHATFSTHDQKEGMTAFAEKPKRKPQWKHS